MVEVIPAANGARVKRLAWNRDPSVAAKGPLEFKLLGELGKQVLIVADAYPSKPGPMSYCQAGYEEFLRVLTIQPQMRETFHLKLQGCISNLELAEPGVIWKPESATLTIHWLTGPRANEHNQTRVYHIDDNGGVKLIEPPAH